MDTPIAKRTEITKGYIKKDVIKMATPTLKPKENSRPQITYNETPCNAAKRLSNCLCGIALISFLGIVSAKLTTDGTAAVMLFVMGLAAIFSKE